MEKKLFNVPVYIYFIVSTLIVIFLFPGETKFGGIFSEEEVKKEQNLFIRSFKPFFSLDDKLISQQLERFTKDIQQMPLANNDAFKTIIVRALKQTYEKGIVSIGDYLFLQENNIDTIRIIHNNTTVDYVVSDVYTLKSAYTHVFDNLLNDSYINPNSEDLQLLNLNTYLHENLSYDVNKSEKTKQDGLMKIAHKNNIQRKYGFISGISILICGLIACFFFYFYYLRRRIYVKKKDVFFSLLMSVLFILLTEICLSFNVFSIYIIPYAIIPIIVRTFFDSRTAQMTHLITVIICSLMVADPFEFIIMQIIVCMVTIYVLKDLTQRSELIKCSFYILATYILTYIGILLFRDGSFSELKWMMLLYFGINFLFVMFAYPFIYILEKIFGYISNVTLVELSDINALILRKLSETCPGTFQHSLQVSMLGAAAATKVKANPQLIRTGALYHDLGKMVNPLYFVENRLAGPDPHANISLEESARIITSHVPEGVKIAEKHQLPEAIIKFIKTHHGKGKAKYFYNTFKNRFPDVPIDEAAFSYSGENPDTRETAILMMADSVEAASRSLADYSEVSLKNLINKIIDGQIADGLLEDAPLTFRNIKDIKQVFLERLLSVYHLRITYPEDKK